MFDSHAHLSHIKFQDTFRFLSFSKESESFRIETGNREDVLRRMTEHGVRGWIEPAIGFDTNEKVLAFCRDMPDAYPALGVHPTRTCRYHEKTPKKLSLFRVFDLARLVGDHAGTVVAVGETGLDFHHKKKYRGHQYFWFVAQILIAHKYRKPLVLHIRMADKEAYRVLRLFRRKLHGGVVHCFCADTATAKKYLDLGFCVGIGGSLLGAPSERTDALFAAVAAMPLDRILIETDSPYVLPEFGDASDGAGKKHIRNTPAILSAVVRRICDAKGLTFEEVEKATEENARRVFHL